MDDLRHLTLHAEEFTLKLLNDSPPTKLASGHSGGGVNAGASMSTFRRASDAGASRMSVSDFT